MNTASGDCGGTGGSIYPISLRLLKTQTAGFITLMSLSGTRNDANNPPWCGHISNCTNVMKREDMKGLLTTLGATTATSPLSNDLRREVKDEFDAWLSVPETRQVNATSIDHR